MGEVWLERVVWGVLAIGAVVLAFGLSSSAGVAAWADHPLSAGVARGVSGVGAVGVWTNSWSLARIGSTVFGGGYVLVAICGARSSRALDGLNAGLLALLCVVLPEALRAIAGDVWSPAIAVVALLLLLVGRRSALWVLLGGALVGTLSAYSGSLSVAFLRVLSF